MGCWTWLRCYSRSCSSREVGYSSWASRCWVEAADWQTNKFDRFRREGHCRRSTVAGQAQLAERMESQHLRLVHAWPPERVAVLLRMTMATSEERAPAKAGALHVASIFQGADSESKGLLLG